MYSSMTRPSLVALLILFASSADADEFTAPLKARKYAEVNAAVSTVLAKDPENANALIAKAKMLTMVAHDTQMDEAVALTERCVAAHPRLSTCHRALGEIAGTRAMRKGILSSLGSAGMIRDSFKTAIQLDPQDMAARFDLLRYYMQAPGIVGGGSDKARTLAADTAKLNAEGGKLMIALIDLIDGKNASAETQALKVVPGNNEDIADMQRDILLSLAWGYANGSKPDDALRLFRETQKRHPTAEGATFGIGVVLQSQGKHQEALAALQQAQAMVPAAEFDYHVGISQQALHDKSKASVSFQKALASKPGLNDKQRTDAEKRLKEL
jgi:tetratricopeptide (TPR) repeat protein